nr:MAG TPA: hypothetical protein [Caudoviricetes sp.]
MFRRESPKYIDILYKHVIIYMGDPQRLSPCGRVSPSGLKNIALNYSYYLKYLLLKIKKKGVNICLMKTNWSK